MKNGHSITPQITRADCPSAKVINAIELPPTMRARRRSPRRQTVIVASTKKTRSNSTLSWPIKVHGFGTRTGAETVSLPHNGRGGRLVFSGRLGLVVRGKWRRSTTVGSRKIFKAGKGGRARG